ncbi:hypothetical protein ACS127_09535 [Amphibacillus sp. Q70]|uniref:hypothetical protein n=1 Tax=Amphibacillus sp. Q70 TaxID=3453416 RepID=UPI003F8728D5
MKKAILMMLLFTAFLFVGCNGTEDTPPEEDAAEQTPEEEEETSESPDEGEEAIDVTLKTMYNAPHGDKAFASTFVVMDGDTIVDVILDEYQFMDNADVTGVPNSDASFGEGSAEDVTLISKLENDEIYSEMMEGAGSTVSYSDNLTAIQDFAIGQTVAEVEAAISELDDLEEDDEIADVVSGATFVDTSGYLQAIVDTANEGFEFSSAPEVNLENAELSYSLQAPHGDQSFAVTAVLHDGDTVLAATIDEFQYLDPADFDGVPNSDAGFGENYNDDVVLASKILNDESYSGMMTDIADATSTYVENIQAIIDHAVGSTVEEIEATIDDLNGLGEDEEIADVVSGATFVDTSGYLQAIVDTVNH